MRVEDLDPPRVVAGAEARILEDLHALGIEWDEGPDVGGPHAPYRQSERSERYLDAIAQLDRDGRLFRCYCSRAEVARAQPQGNAHPDEDGPRYPGTCRELSREAQSAHEKSGRRPSLRFRVDEGPIAFLDGARGPEASDPGLAGDFVVRRADGLFAYQLAVVVDDAAMAIDEVVRGADLLGSTGRQLALFAALGRSPPRFAHVPLLCGPDGERLAKRHGSIAVRELVARGISPAIIVGALAASLGLASASAQLSPRDLLNRFDLANLPREATRIDPAAIVAGRAPSL
jgi:glutamyl-tRNA synthetase